MKVRRIYASRTFLKTLRSASPFSVHGSFCLLWAEYSSTNLSGIGFLFLFIMSIMRILDMALESFFLLISPFSYSILSCSKMLAGFFGFGVGFSTTSEGVLDG